MTGLLALNPNSNTRINQPVFTAVIVWVVVLCLELMFVLSSFNEAAENSKIVYAEKPPTSNSRLAYGNSGTLELEPFSGKILHAYIVPYSSQEIESYYLKGQIGIVAIVITLCLLVYNLSLPKFPHSNTN